MIFRQLVDPDTSTYTYLLADETTRDAVLIDPVREQVDRDVALLDELGLRLVYTLETHVHADHVTGSGTLRDRVGARTVASVRAGADCADVRVDHGDRIEFGRHTIEVLATPGHTAGCVTYVVRDGDRVLAFTGDALFVRGCGRTDFQQGDARTLFRSVRDVIFALPDHTLVYPGHDYRGYTVTTVAEEKRHNPRLRLGVTEDEFVAIMGGLNLPKPRHMDVAVPANLACGGAA
ncbi:MAG: MBL fold metallo-hydrolase [Deltaproteobacteria bacterium]|nr:MAG: MBL fold metallo-hydrolase [Deltaproteobacteria bacterium]